MYDRIESVVRNRIKADYSLNKLQTTERQLHKLKRISAHLECMPEMVNNVFAEMIDDVAFKRDIAVLKVRIKDIREEQISDAEVQQDLALVKTEVKVLELKQTIAISKLSRLQQSPTIMQWWKKNMFMTCSHNNARIFFARRKS